MSYYTFKRIIGETGLTYEQARDRCAEFNAHLTAAQKRKGTRLEFTKDSNPMKTYSRYVWHLGKCWHNPGHLPDRRGFVSLYSLKEDGAGINADPKKIQPCDDKTTVAILEAQAAGQLIKF